MQDFVGKQIDRYRIIERLGTGGMAVVYKAYDTRLGRDVALKLIRMEAVPAEHHSRLIDRFKREAYAMARLNHPNIVQVFDCGEYEGAPYLVMAYIDGGTLKGIVGNPINYQKALTLLIPIAEALSYAHEQGIIHRDIKPANILITKSGLIMLSDFGIAKFLESQDATLTSTDLGVGTPQYMAPEQWKNQVCPQTDIYALGTVLYELITGARPYDADTPAAVAIVQATEPLVRPKNLIPDLPDNVEKLIFKALATKPEDRYLSMSAFVSAINKTRYGVSDLFHFESPTQTMVEPMSVDSEGTTFDHYEIPLDVAKIKRQSLPTPVKKNRFWIYILVGFLILIFGTAFVFGASLLSGYWTSSKLKNTSLKTTPSPQASHSLSLEGDSVSESSDSKPAIAATTPINTKAEYQSVQKPDHSSTSPSVGAQATSTSMPTLTKEPILGIGSSFSREIDGMIMMFIPAGKFLMGASGDSNAFAHEKPQHEVYLDAFWMDAYQVSNAMFASFVNSTSYLTQAEKQGYSYMYNTSGQWGIFSGVNWRHPMGDQSTAQDDLPVVHVNYYDADAYCKWAGGRLPSEAEWEKAARGEDGRLYPWGSSFDASNLHFGSAKGPASVYSYPSGQSPYGIYNMTGNVFEWTNDFYSESYYSISPEQNPLGPSIGSRISLRGGSWKSSQNFVRVTHRDTSEPEYMNYLLGFRCVIDVEY